LAVKGPALIKEGRTFAELIKFFDYMLENFFVAIDFVAAFRRSLTK
jgi:hypothetical protein